MILRTIGDVATDVFHHPGFKSMVALFLYVFTYLFGTGDVFVSVALPIVLLIILDAATRFALNLKDRELDDHILKISAKKLFVYCSYIIMGRIVDHDIPGDIATLLFKSFIIGTECLAIISTLGKLGFPLSPKILKYFKDFTDDGTEIKK